EADPEIEILPDRQHRLDAGLMAEEMALLADRRAGPAALQHERSGGSRQQAGDQPQQRGLAGAVAAAQRQRLARPHRETDVAEDRAAGPPAGELLPRQPQGSAPACKNPSIARACPRSYGHWLSIPL